MFPVREGDPICPLLPTGTTCEPGKGSCRDPKRHFITPLLPWPSFQSSHQCPDLSRGNVQGVGGSLQYLREVNQLIFTPGTTPVLCPLGRWEGQEARGRGYTWASTTVTCLIGVSLFYRWENSLRVVLCLLQSLVID